MRGGGFRKSAPAFLICNVTLAHPTLTRFSTIVKWSAFARA